MQPGQTITPQSVGPQPTPPANPPQPTPNPPTPEPAPPTWQFRSNNGAPVPDLAMPPPPAPVETIDWTASEFIAHHKPMGWYGLLAGGGALAAVLVYAITRDRISAAMMIVVAAVFGTAASRKPRILHYQLDDDGLNVGKKFYDYGQFKSFSIINEGALNSVSLLPLHRFMPPMTVYYDPKDEQRIVTVLSIYLPFEERSQAPVDRLMRKIRF